MTRYAGSLLYREGVEAKDQHATVWCLRHLASMDGGDIFRASDGSGARFTGLATCGFVWTCPSCANRISEERRRELDAGMVRHVGAGGAVYLASFTFPHARDDAAADLFDRQAKAIKLFKGSKVYRRILGKDGTAGRIGSAKSLETTHGGNGWHPHTHELWFAKPRGLGEGGAADDGSLSSADISALRGAWIAAIERAGLLPNDRIEWAWRYAFDVRGGEKAAQYIAKFGHDEKWGMSREATGHMRKIGTVDRQGDRHRTPFQLLADASLGDVEAGALFVEYARAVQGRRMLVWSPGLKAALGIKDRTDEEIAADEAAKPSESKVARYTPEQIAVLTARRALGEAGEFVALYLDAPDCAQEMWDAFVEAVRLRPREGAATLLHHRLKVSGPEVFTRGTVIGDEGLRSIH